MEVSQVSLWLEDHHAANYRCIAETGYSEDPAATQLAKIRPGRAASATLVDGRKTPFLLEAEELQRIFANEVRGIEMRGAAIAPLQSGFGIRGWIAVRASKEGLDHFGEERMRLLEGLSYRASVALQKTVLLRSEQESAEVAAALLEFSRSWPGVATRSRLSGGSSSSPARCSARRAPGCGSSRASRDRSRSGDGLA